MTQPNTQALAQTDANAIAALLNQLLQPQGITAKAVSKDVCLQIMLESTQGPDAQAVMPLIHNRVTDFKLVKLWLAQL